MRLSASHQAVLVLGFSAAVAFPVQSARADFTITNGPSDAIGCTQTSSGTYCGGGGGGGGGSSYGGGGGSFDANRVSIPGSFIAAPVATIAAMAAAPICLLTFNFGCLERAAKMTVEVNPVYKIGKAIADSAPSSQAAATPAYYTPPPPPAMTVPTPTYQPATPSYYAPPAPAPVTAPSGWNNRSEVSAGASSGETGPAPRAGRDNAARELASLKLAMRGIQQKLGRAAGDEKAALQMQLDTLNDQIRQLEARGAETKTAMAAPHGRHHLQSGGQPKPFGIAGSVDPRNAQLASVTPGDRSGPGPVTRNVPGQELKSAARHGDGARRLAGEAASMEARKGFDTYGQPAGNIVYPQNVGLTQDARDLAARIPGDRRNSRVAEQQIRWYSHLDRLQQDAALKMNGVQEKLRAGAIDQQTGNAELATLKNQIDQYQGQKKKIEYRLAPNAASAGQKTAMAGAAAPPKQ